MDPEVSTALQTYLEAEGVRVCTGIGYQRIANAVNGIELTCESRSCDGEDCSDTVVTVQTIRAEQVLIAAGGRPQRDGRGRADSGISISHRGGSLVNVTSETNTPADHPRAACLGGVHG